MRPQGDVRLTWNRWTQTGNFRRVFLVPGMDHCAGGPATDDALAALDAWVENRVLP